MSLRYGTDDFFQMAKNIFHFLSQKRWLAILVLNSFHERK